MYRGQPQVSIPVIIKAEADCRGLELNGNKFIGADNLVWYATDKGTSLAWDRDCHMYRVKEAQPSGFLSRS